MKKENLEFIAKISLIIFIYIIIYFFYKGLISKIYEGDSINYHIPIAKAFLDGTITNPANINAVPFLKYYPGSSEGFISILMFLKIPINTFNVFAVFFLFLSSFFLGKRFGLKNELSVIFASCISTLHTIVRWINTQVIDIWLLVFFALSLALVQKPQKKLSYFVLLGFSCGMLIGTKYTGVYFLFVLLIFNFKKILKVINLKLFIAFLIPFITIGGLWYLRNYLLTGDPIYPQDFLFFKGTGAYFQVLGNNVLRSFFYPNGVSNNINAFISEYGVFVLSLFTPFLFLVKKIRNNRQLKKAKLLLAMGFLNLIIFSILPSDRYYNVVISVVRYTYPAFIPLILSVFIISEKLKKEVLISVIALSSLIIIPELSFYPKLIILFIPLSLIVFYFEDVYAFVKNKVPVKDEK